MKNSKMLHNTGPYGSNETPVNVGAPDISELATPMNIAQNFSNFMKMSQQTIHPTSGHFNFQNYPGFSGTSLSGDPPVSMFPNNPFQSGSAITHTSYFDNPIRHNGGLPENYCFNNEMSQSIVDFSNYANKLNNFNASTDGLKTQRRPFNVPQITNKEDFNEQSSDRYSNPDNEYKKNENLFAPWKNCDGEVVNKCDPKNNDLNTKSQENLLERECYDRSDDSSMSDQQDNTNKSIQSNNKDKKDSQKLSEDNHSDDSNVTDNEETPKDTKLNDKDNVKPQDDNDSDSNDMKPLNLVHYIKEEPVDYIDTGGVVVKIEQISSWTDTEHMQPFLKDMNGVLRDGSSLNDMVDCGNSVARAMEIVANGLKTDLGFECPNCCLLFTHPKRFLIHTKWHSFGLINEKRIEDAKEKMACRQQKKEMQILIKKEAAVLRKTEIGVFNCKDCEKTFNTLSKLRNHRHKYHPNREHECKVCQKKVMGWFGLQKHMAIHKGDCHQCDLCPKRFKHAHSLSKHRDTHLEKTHACAECPKKFGSQTLLKIHMRSHERALRGRTFRCTYCGKGFYEAYTLQYHERTHRNERPFKCEICETSYGTNSSLKRHLKVSHSDAKPFMCDTCRRCFTTALIRDRHAARAHGTPGQLQYACTQCTSRYMRHKDLQRHMYRIHPKGKKRRKDSESE